MQQLFCAITGDKYAWVVQDTPESQKKIQALAIAVLVPTLLWLANGFLLAYRVLQASPLVSAVIGIGCALVIFVVEKLVVMSSGGFLIGALRILMGLAIAFIGSLALDEAFFHDDITNGVEGIKLAHVKAMKDSAGQQFAQQHELDSVKSNVMAKELAWQHAVELTLKEVDGVSTGQVGFGKRARYKDGLANEKKAEFEAAKAVLDSLLQAQAFYADSAGRNVAQNFNANGLLVRLEALFALIKHNPHVRLVYIVFTFVFFCFELIAIIFKLSWKKTNYERKLQFIEQLGEKRLEHLRLQHALHDTAYNYAKAQVRNIGKGSCSSFSS